MIFTEGLEEEFPSGSWKGMVSPDSWKLSSRWQHGLWRACMVEAGGIDLIPSWVNLGKSLKLFEFWGYGKNCLYVLWVWL